MSRMASVLAAANDTLLDYQITTSPSPLQASPAGGDPAVGEIDIVVSNGTDAPIYCNKITIALPVGDDAQDVVAAANTSVIHCAATPSDQWQLLPAGSSDPGVFIATPLQTGYQELTTDGLFLQIYNIKVNGQVGTFELDLQESSGPDGNTFTNHDAAFLLPKFPYGFSFGDFTASSPQVANGSSVTLSWTGSENATYTILAGGASPVDVTNVRSWPSPPLHSDTTFILDAAVVVNNVTVHHYASVTVTVLDPDLVASTLSVLGASGLAGATSVGTTAAPANLAVSGQANVSGGATVGGALSAASAAVSGNGSVGGQLSVSGLLNALGPVAMRALGAPQSVASGTYTAGTDGLLIGQVNGNGINSNSKAIGWADAWCGGVYVQATGGNTVVWMDPGAFSTDWYHANLGGSFVLPVQKGATYTCRWTAGSGLDKTPSYGFWWYPLGGGGSGELTRVGDADLLTMPAPSGSPATGAAVRAESR
jgi:hypothetical protein